MDRLDAMHLFVRVAELGSFAAVAQQLGLARSVVTRQIAALEALTGAWRHRAGGMLLSSSGQFPAQRAALQRPDLMPARTPRTLNMVLTTNQSDDNRGMAVAPPFSRFDIEYCINGRTQLTRVETDAGGGIAIGPPS